MLEFTADREGYMIENAPEGNEPISDKIVVAGLSKRTGNSLTTTASTILTSIPKESQSESVAFRDARNVLVQHFDSLHPFTQEWLLRVFGEQLRDPALIPSLKKMLTATGVAAKNMHETALLKLLEMTPNDVRPYVVAEIRNPDSFLDVETLGKLKDDSLPEVDASLLEQIRKLTWLTASRGSSYRSACVSCE